MAWCLMAPSHYLTQCWLIIIKIIRGMYQYIFRIILLSSIIKMNFIQSMFFKWSLLPQCSFILINVIPSLRSFRPLLPLTILSFNIQQPPPDNIVQCGATLTGQQTAPFSQKTSHISPMRVSYKGKIWGVFVQSRSALSSPFVTRLLYLTHWGRATHICVGKLTTIGSDNGLLPGRRQAIIWTNARVLLIGPVGTNFSEILIGIQTFSFKKMHLQMSSAKWRPFVSTSMS